MSSDYTFVDMLKDIFFNGNKVSRRNHDDSDDDYSYPGGGYYNDIPSSSTSRDFDPSDSAGEAFRSIFGDDN